MRTHATLLLLFLAQLTFAQMEQPADFDAAFRQHMLTPTNLQQQPTKLTFEQRDVLHTHLAGGILATVGIPVLVASIVHFNGNPALAGTGAFFGGLAVGGSITLHSIGLKKLVKYTKEGKLRDALETNP